MARMRNRFNQKARQVKTKKVEVVDPKNKVRMTSTFLTYM